MALLEVRNITKAYGSETVLNNISFDLEKFETLSILGSSGSGKTTLLRCLNYLEIPDDGEIILDNEVYFSKDKVSTYDEDTIRQKRLHFGMVFQQFNLFPQYTALENIQLALKLVKKEKETEDKAIELLKKMGLKNRMDHYPHQLSGGQQQRVAIARALALEPDILCFDEPTSALDPELTSEVLKVIKELANSKTTMIIVTHEINFAKEVSDKILFMDNAEQLDFGSVREVLINPRNQRIEEFLNSNKSE